MSSASSPDVEVEVVSGTIEPGESEAVSVYVHNRDANQKVTNATVTFSIDGDGSVNKRTVDIGTIPANSSAFEVVTVSASESAEDDLNLDTGVSYTVDGGSTNYYASQSSDINVIEFADFSLDSADSSAPAGSSDVVSFELENTGERSAEDVEVSLSSVSPKVEVSALDSVIPIGEMGENEERDVEFEITLDESLDEGEEVPVDVVVNYNDGTERVSELDFIVSAESERDVSASRVGGVVPVGGSGDVVFEIENNANIRMSEVDVTLNSQSSVVSFGGLTQSSQRLSDIESSESVQFTETVTVAETGREDAMYGMELVVEYEDSNGVSDQIKRDIAFSPDAEQQLSVDFANTNISEGTSSSTEVGVSNRGPKKLQDVEVSIKPRNDVSVTPNSFIIESIGVNETVTRNVTVEAPLNSNSLLQEFDVVSTYEYDELERPQTEESSTTLMLTEVSSEFGVKTVGSENITQGGSGVISIEVTNNLDERVTGIDAEVSSQSPLSVSDGSSYIDELNPGESETINVTVEAEDSATLNSYPLTIDFQYDDSDGDSRLSELYSVPVNITERGEGYPLGIVGAIVGFVLLSGAVYYRSNIAELFD